MPKLLLKIECEKMPPLYAAREVKTLGDLRRLFSDAQDVIAKAVKVFPDAADFTPVLVTVKHTEKHSTKRRKKAGVHVAPAA